jgi:hypothetical protein
MTVRWFVQSRGPRREHPDYNWRAVGTSDSDDGSRYARTVLDRGWRGHGCLSLIDDESEGALFFDDRHQGLVLLITGLTPAEHPSDFQRRPIRVAVLGTARRDDPAAWSEMTAVAAQALRGELAEPLPVTFGYQPGNSDFEVDAAVWSGLVNTWCAAEPDPAAEVPDRAGTKLWPDEAGYRVKVAAKLDAIGTVGIGPLAERIILLRTNLLSRQDIQDLRPWRTLSDVTDRTLVMAEADEHTDLTGQVENIVRDVVKGLTSNARKWGIPLLGVLIVAGIIVVLTRPAGQRADTTHTVAIADSSPWTATGIKVLAGDRLTILPTGSIRVQIPGGGTVVVTPAGIPHGTGAGRPCGGINPASQDAADVTVLPCWLLTARIGPGGRPFQVTSRTSVAAPDSGDLYLGLNDWCPCDITGQLTARIQVQAPPS